jgi:hypothetical protein
MAYFMRFVSLDLRPFSLAELESALRTVDAKYSISRSGKNTPNGELRYGRSLYALLEISKIDDDVAELRAALAEIENEAAKRVHESLANVTDVLTVEVKYQGRGTEKTVRMLDPISGGLQSQLRPRISSPWHGFQLM